MTWSIQVSGLAKMYRIGRGPTQKFDSVYEVVTDAVLGAAEKLTKGRSARFLPARVPARPLEIQSEHMVLSESQFEGAPPGHFWALRDISFRVEEGQRIGIIGRNGSGKSTLLKILSRITSPTAGEFKFRGRLISLLEIGTGFHPDLSGRENVYLNAKINGLTDRQIRAVFDEIVDFSELGVQIDTPIKRYSSGMYMRLAFSVAAHLNSEILVVDEVLAVGDAGFQKKCLTKMLDIGNSGRTLLFVSHDMDAVRKLCSSALELSHGRIVAHEITAERPALAPVAGEEIGVGSGLQAVSTAIADYSLEGGGAPRTERSWSLADAPKSRSGRLALRAVSLRAGDGSPRSRFAPDDAVALRLELTRAGSVHACTLRIDIATVTGRSLVSSTARLDLGAPTRADARQEVTCRIPGPFFNPGVFKMTLVLADVLDATDTVTVNDVVNLVVETPAQAAPRAAGEAPLGPGFDWSVGESRDEGEAPPAGGTDATPIVNAT